MSLMTGYEELLEATIQHLEELKGRGVRFVSIAPETLSALANSKVRKLGFTSQKPIGEKPQVKRANPEIGKVATKSTAAALTAGQSLALDIPGEKIAKLAAPALSPEAKAA